MTAMFVSFALPLLFVGSGLFALTVLTLTWLTYGRELAGLRAQLAASAEWRDFEVRVATVQVREFTVPVRRSAVRGRATAGQARQTAGRRAAA
jgi:hypothetical protein